MPAFNDKDRLENALHVARLYYYQNLTTEVIARDMQVSRSTVSRLLSLAKEEGLVEIRIKDPSEQPRKLEKIIGDRFRIQKVHVVPVPESAGEAEWLEQVALYSANYLNTLFDSGMILGLAWGTTTSTLSKYLQHKDTYQSQIVQLNGAGNTQSTGIDYASQIVMRFSQNYGARAHLFPVPTFFDYPETKCALWKESSIRRLLDLQQQADLLLCSIGTVNARVPSHVYSGGYLEKRDYLELERENIAGDIATVFFREDGRFDGIPMNERSSGPSLELFQRKHGICVVSGLAKVRGLFAALKGGLMKELIVDEPTARRLIEKHIVP